MSFDVPGLDWSGGMMVPAFQAMQHLDVFDFRGASRDEQVAATIVAGIVNRPQPRVYLLTGNDDALWLKAVFGAVPQTVSSHNGHNALAALIEAYRSSIQRFDYL